MTSYRHTVHGTPIAAVIGAAWLVVVAVASAVGAWPATAAAAVLCALVAVLFSSMTIRLDGTVLSWRLGIGLLGHRLDIAQIREVTVRPAHPWSELGYHLQGRRRLWRVGGNSVVCLTLRDGREICLGTDEPERLSEAVASSRTFRGETATHARRPAP